MTLSPARERPTSVRRLSVTLYGYAFLDEFILFYPVYVLLFADTGLSVGEISTLFVLWSVTGLLLEVPSGIWADLVSRRLLLVVGQLAAAAGFALWAAVPSYWAFAAGFVLWGIRGALVSGALEALVYEELDRLGAAHRYGGVMGRARAVGLAAVLLAMAAAGPVLALGGYPLVGAASALACLFGAAVGRVFPQHRAAVTGPVPATVAAAPDMSTMDGAATGFTVGDRSDATAGAGAGAEADDAAGPPGWWDTLRLGIAQTRADRAVLRAVLLIPAVDASWGALEEYVPLLARATGAQASLVTLLVLLVAAGVTGGGLLAGVGQRMREPVFAAALAFAGLALAGGALSGRPVGFVAVAVAFCVLQMASVVVDARLQERITGPARATVTSLAALATELVTLLVFAGYALVSGAVGHGPAFALFALPYLGLASLLARRRKKISIDTFDSDDFHRNNDCLYR